MFSKLKSLQAVLLFLCLSLVIVSCGDDDSSTSPTSGPKVKLNLETEIEGLQMSKQIPILIKDGQEDLDISDIGIYLGDQHISNRIGDARVEEQNGIKYLVFFLPTTISSSGKFVAAKNWNYNSMECNPEDIARTIQPVKFFTESGNNRNYELVLGDPKVEDVNELTSKYLIHFWSAQGTAEGYDGAYDCDYRVIKGWNISQEIADKRISLNNLPANAYAVIK